MINNIGRDGFFLDLAAATDFMDWGQANGLNQSAPVVSCQPNVNYDYGNVVASTETSVTTNATEYVSVGVFMEPPRKDRMPYRVKANVMGNGTVVVGFAPQAPTGTSHTIIQVRHLPFVDRFDDLIMLEPELDGDTWAGRAIYFGVCAQGAQSATFVAGAISVQNLGVKPPTMQNAVA